MGEAMAEGAQPLTDEERAELEQLRAEKAEREAIERARAERAELERLRAERTERDRSTQDAFARRDARDREAAAARERARQLMEPGEDLSMPKAQRIVLVCVALIVVAIVVGTMFLHS